MECDVNSIVVKINSDWCCVKCLYLKYIGC